MPLNLVTIKAMFTNKTNDVNKHVKWDESLSVATRNTNIFMIIILLSLVKMYYLVGNIRTK